MGTSPPQSKLQDTSPAQEVTSAGKPWSKKATYENHVHCSPLKSLYHTQTHTHSTAVYGGPRAYFYCYEVPLKEPAAG